MKLQDVSATINGDLIVNGTTYISGATTMNSTLSVTGAITSSAGINVPGDKVVHFGSDQAKDPPQVK